MAIGSGVSLSPPPASCPAHLAQPRLPAAEREDEAHGEAMLGVADFLQELLHALGDEVKELQRQRVSSCPPAPAPRGAGGGRSPVVP